MFCLTGLSGSLTLYRNAIEAAMRPSWKATKLWNPASVLNEETATSGRVGWRRYPLKSSFHALPVNRMNIRCGPVTICP